MTSRLTLAVLLPMFACASLAAALKVSPAGSDLGTQRSNRRYEIELQRQIDELQSQLARLGAKKKALIGKLEAIVTLAKKEEAPETAQQVQQLMEQINSNYAAERKTLERKLDRFKQVAQKVERRERLEKNTGAKARGFTLKDAQGKDVSLNAYKGKIIVLEWMSPECPYTRYYYERKIIPGLISRYKDSVVWLSINSTPGISVKEIQAFAKRYGLTHPILDDKSGMVARAYGVRKIPHIFIIDRKGMIAYNGALDDSPAKGGKPKLVNNYVEKALAQLLANKPVSVSFAEPIGSPLGRNP